MKLSIEVEALEPLDVDNFKARIIAALFAVPTVRGVTVKGDGEE